MVYGGAALGRVNGFVLQKLLGKGSFGTVYQATRETDGKTYAIKKVDTRRMGAKDRAEAVNEIRVLASVAGAHIISFFEAFVEQDMLYIVTEFAAHGDLFGWLKEARKRGPLKEATVWSLFIQMSLGLKSLHDRNILHRDLKGANIFMCSPSYIKLGDFGVSKVLKSDQALARTQVGTPYYVAPEVWRNRPYNASCDIWSLGCLLYELCTFRPPFEAESMEGLARKIMQGKFSPIPAGYSRELHGLIDRLLVVDPIRRATVDDILAHKGVVERMASIPLADSFAAMGDGQVDLMGTIIVPQRFNDLHKNLPPSRYEPHAPPAPAPAAQPPAALYPPLGSGGVARPGQAPGLTGPFLNAVMDAQGRVPIVPRAQPMPSPPAPQGTAGFYPAPLKPAPLPSHPVAVPQNRYRDSAVPSLPAVPGAARKPPPVSASAAAARQMAAPNYRPLHPAGHPGSRPGSAQSKTGAAPRPGSANIRVVYHNPLGYKQPGSNHSIFRGNSNLNSQYNPITHQAAYLARQVPPVPSQYQSRLAKIHNPSQHHQQMQAMYAAQQGRVPIRVRA